jgi:hypothetical protein
LGTSDDKATSTAGSSNAGVSGTNSAAGVCVGQVPCCSLGAAARSCELLDTVSLLVRDGKVGPTQRLLAKDALCSRE